MNHLDTLSLKLGDTQDDLNDFFTELHSLRAGDPDIEEAIRALQEAYSRVSSARQALFRSSARKAKEG